jgi:hypothetical protein
MWLVDANCIHSRYPGFDNDITAGDGQVTWQHALDFVAGINAGTYSNCGAGYSNWRLPNVNELESLINAEKPNTAYYLNMQGFDNVQWDYYWSSTTYAGRTEGAWILNMWAGGVRVDSKTVDNYVWPVRSIPPASQRAQLWRTGQTTSYYSGDDGDQQRGVFWPSPRFIDNGDGTVTDDLTGLMWSKNSSPRVGSPCKSSNLSWQEALDYVKCLNTKNYLGYSDWRLPNRKELRSLINYGKDNPAIWLSTQGFSNVQLSWFYWSSTTLAGSGSDHAWGVPMWDGGEYSYRKNYKKGYVWPVRAGSFDRVMVTGDLDGNGKDEVIIDFGSGYGIWIRYNDSYWFKLHKLSPDSMVTGDLDGNGKDEVIIDFGSDGIWVRDNNISWGSLIILSPQWMVTGDADGNGKDEVIINFGSGFGIMVRYNNNTWSKLHD